MKCPDRVYSTPVSQLNVGPRTMDLFSEYSCWVCPPATQACLQFQRASAESEASWFSSCEPPGKWREVFWLPWTTIISGYWYIYIYICCFSSRLSIISCFLWVWFFLESTGNVNTIGGQLTLACEIRSA